MDLWLKRPTVDTRHIRRYSYLWTIVGILAIICAIVITTCVLLQPFDDNVPLGSSVFGFWKTSESAPSLSFLFFISLSFLFLLIFVLVILNAIDQRIYRFRFSACFMRVGFYTVLWSIVLIIIGIVSQPIDKQDHIINTIWTYHNNKHMMSGVGIYVLISSIVFLLYLVLEITVGVVHEVKCIRRYLSLRHIASKSLALAFNTYVDKLSLIYGRFFNFWKRIYYQAGFKQHTVKWKVINRYIVYNFLYSLFFCLCVIFLIVFFSAFNKIDAPKVSAWLIPTMLFFCFLFLTILFWILNIFHTLRLLRNVDKASHPKIHLYYTLGLFLPWVGTVYQILLRKHASINSDKKLVIEIKNRRQPFVVVSNIAKTIMSLALGVVIFVVSFVGSTIMAKYNPTPNTYLPLKTDDHRTQRDEGFPYDTTVHSALTYNIGFNAYNHDMHFFNDAAGHFLNGQSRATSAISVNKSLDGVVRTLGMYHDAKDGYNWDNSIDDASNLYGIRTIWKSTFANIASVNDYGRWTQDSCVFGPDNTDIATPIDFSDTNYNADAELGTHDGLYDFVSIEEIDRNSTRSRYVDEYDQLMNSNMYVKGTSSALISELKNYYASTFAYNYVVPYVPVPLNEPEGKVLGGLCTLSRYNTQGTIAQRYGLTSIPGIYGLFQLRRCLIINKIPLINPSTQAPIKNSHGDQEYFIYINGHLDAYDQGGMIRRLQLKAINNLFEDFLFYHNPDGSRSDKTGNYVLMGADWNLTLPDTKGYEGDDNYPNDDAPIAPFNWTDYKYKANPTNSNDISNWEDYNLYHPTNSYKKGDIVRALCPLAAGSGASAPYVDNEDINVVNGIIGETKKSTNDSTYTDFQSSTSTGTALYKAITDVPQNQAPTNVVVAINPGRVLNDRYWKLYYNSIYEGNSLNWSARKNYLPIADPELNMYTGNTDYDNTRVANFYANHAIPSSRNAGVRYFGDNEKISENSDLTQYKHSIDGFLASWNINVVATYSYDNNYIYADHMPVTIKFNLKV